MRLIRSFVPEEPHNMKNMKSKISNAGSTGKSIALCQDVLRLFGGEGVAVAEGLAEAVAEGKVGGVDGVEGDEVLLFEVGLAVGGKEFFIADDVDDFGHKVEAGFGFVVFLDDAALEGQGEVVVKGCVDVGYNTPRFSDRHNYGGMTNNRYICKKEENRNGKTIEIYSFFQGESRRGSAQGNGATGVAGQEIWRGTLENYRMEERVA